MTSARQRSANQQTARKSRGPRTAAGKLRASKNAIKHGLSAKTGSTKVERRRMDQVVLRLTAGSNDAWMIDKAQHVAECHLQLEKVKALVNQLIHQLLQTKDLDQVQAFSRRLIKLERYETRARSRRKRALRDYLDISLDRSPAAQ